MDAYLEIRILPDPEFQASTLMNALFSKLHRGLVEHGGQCIGVSFPEVKETGAFLGSCLRIHGEANELSKLMTLNWLIGMRDHVEVSAIMPVPSNAKYRVVRRIQAKSNPERLRRRLIARKGISEEDAKEAIPDTAAEKLNFPYIVLTSRSTNQKFRLFCRAFISPRSS